MRALLSLSPRPGLRLTAARCWSTLFVDESTWRGRAHAQARTRAPARGCARGRGRGPWGRGLRRSPRAGAPGRRGAAEHRLHGAGGGRCFRRQARARLLGSSSGRRFDQAPFQACCPISPAQALGSRRRRVQSRRRAGTMSSRARPMAQQSERLCFSVEMCAEAQWICVERRQEQAAQCQSLRVLLGPDV